MNTITFILAFAGAIPFVLLSVDELSAYVPSWLLPRDTSLLLYSAIILSFMGGAQWGYLLKSKANLEGYLYFSLSVVPALGAWWLFTHGGNYKTTCLSLAAAFAALLVYEAWLAQRGFYPAWFGRTRLFATLVVSISLVNAGMDWL